MIDSAKENEIEKAIDSLPDDAMGFLSSEKTKKVYDWPDLSRPGSTPSAILHAEFYNYSELKVINVPLSTWQYRNNHDTESSRKDPNMGTDGFYKITAVDLIKDVNDYAPSGLFIWIPELGQFGTADMEHGVVYIFRNLSWKIVTRHLKAYINHQWNPFHSNGNKVKDIYDVCNPWELWAFK